MTHSPACERQDLHAMLARYEFGAVSVEERTAVETHVLDCDGCFAELERGAHVVPVLRGRRAHWTPILGAAPATEVGTSPADGATPRATTRQRRARILAPSLLVAAIAVVVAVRTLRAPSPSDLATFPTERLGAEIQRGPASGDAVEELIATGAAHFDLRHYDEAARRFRAAFERDPARADAAYLAGLATVLTGDARAALPDLERAVELAGDPLRSEAEWVLANAYLRAGMLAPARRVLVGLRDAGGPYAGRAGALLVRMGAAPQSDAGGPGAALAPHRTPPVRLAAATPVDASAAGLAAARQLFDAERWAPAREQAERVATAAAQRGDATGEIEARTLAAECAFQAGLMPQAGNDFAAAAALAAHQTDSRHAIVAQEGVARVQAARGDARRALPAFRAVLPAARRARDRPLECRALLGIGQCQNALGDRSAAIETFEQARALARQTASPAMEARVLQDLAMARHHAGEPEAAVALLDQALQLAHRAGKKQDIVGVSVRAAVVHIDLAQYSRALAVLSAAQPLAAELGHRRALLNIRGRQASIYAALGRPEAAIAELDAGLDIARHMQSTRAQAGLLRRKANALVELGRDDEAARVLDDAQRIMRTLGNPHDDVDMLHVLGEFHLARGRLEAAGRMLLEARAGLDSVQDSHLEGHVECLLGEVAAQRGDSARARTHAAGAIARARTAHDAAVLRDALRLDARLCSDAGDLQGADRRLATAIEVAETVRAGLADAEHRVGFHATSRPLYVDRVRVLYDLGGPAHAEAFRVMEQARARALLDALAGTVVEPETPIDPALRARQAACLRRLRGLQTELSRAEADGRGSAAAFDSLTRAHVDASHALREIRSEIAVRAPSYGALLGVTPPLVEADVRARVLVPGQVLLEYQVGPEATYVCVIDTGGLRLQRLAVGAAALEELVVACRTAIVADDGGAILTTSRRLYDLLVAPIAATLPPDARLLIVPDAALCELPFAALHDGERFLVERYPIATAPSASALDPRLHRTAARRAPRLLAVGNPASYREAALLASVRALHGWSFGELPYAEEEARRIGRHFRRKSILIGAAATEEAVKAQIGRASVVHFATHGVLDASEPLLCGLVLAQDDDPREDGLLQVHEILGLRLDADLVVLSACGSGLGRRVGGEGVLGLTRAFLHTGAQRLLIALWDVGDRSTVGLMERFYALRFEAGLPTDVALRAAQLEGVAHGRPREWAPFAVTGAVEPGAAAVISTRAGR